MTIKHQRTMIPLQFFDNGEAGIHITGSTNFTFEATFGDEYDEGEGYVGSVEGPQPIEVVVESSSLITFQDMSVRSANSENGRPLEQFSYHKSIYL